jgi:hypothetical protein
MKQGSKRGGTIRAIQTEFQETELEKSFLNIFEIPTKAAFQIKAHDQEIFLQFKMKK